MDEWGPQGTGPVDGVDVGCSSSSGWLLATAGARLQGAGLGAKGTWLASQ